MIKTVVSFVLASILLFTASSAKAQSGWTLQKCIDHALENNIMIRQGKLAVADKHLSYLQSKEAFLPSVSGFANYNFSFGRNINPVNNTYVQQNVQSSQFGITTQLTVFNGLHNVNTYKLSQINEAVSLKDLEVISNNISLQVATQFLQILFNEETIKTVTSRIASTEKQLETANILFNSGNSNQSSVFELEAKLASDNLDLVNARNNLRLSLLALANLLQEPFDDNFKIESPQISIPEEVIVEGSAAIYNKALRVMPEIELAILQHTASKMNESVFKAGYYPSLSVNANLSSLFSNNFKDFTNPKVVLVPIGYVQNSNEVVLSPSYTYDGLRTIPFSNQVNNNLGKSIGFNLNVPIYSNGKVRTAVKRAEIQSAQQQLNIRKAENDLYTTVATAVANYTGARSKYMALSLAAESQKKNFDFNSLRFEAGALSPSDLVISLKNYEVAEANLLQGKYDLVFRKVLLDFYRGKPLVLN